VSDRLALCAPPDQLNRRYSPLDRGHLQDGSGRCAIAGPTTPCWTDPASG
jgi:hypothetical protein